MHSLGYSTSTRDTTIGQHTRHITEHTGYAKILNVT